MSIEQVARDFVLKMNDVDAVKAHVTPDAIAIGGVLPKPIPVTEAIHMLDGLTAGIPDIKYDVKQVVVNGDQAIVNAWWGGTQTGPINMPGLPAVPPTGKKVSVKDTYILTFKGDKISKFQIDSPVDGGIPAALAQLGVQLPRM